MTEGYARPKRAFFLIGECAGVKRLVRGESASPEGDPSVYLTWLAYKKRGYNVDVFYIGRFKQEQCNTLDGCVIHTVPRRTLARALSNAAGRSLGMYLRLIAENASLYRSAARVARTSPPSVVYALRPPHVYAARRLATQHGACFVKRMFGTLLYPELTGHGRERTLAQHIAERRAWRCPADMTIITNDGTNGDKVAQLLGIPSDRYRLWFNGIDKTWTGTREVSSAYRAKIGLSSKDFILLCLSRLQSWKRQDRAIRAMELVVREMPNARLVLAGDGGLRTSLEKMVADLDLTADVKFIGTVAHQDVQTVMGMADVFLQTNDYSNLGNTLLEAMVCECPIVTWDVGGTGQVIRDNETGRLLPDPEPDTIARAVIELARDPEKARQLGTNARKFVEERLPTWDERLNMEIDLVEGLCARKADI